MLAKLSRLFNVQNLFKLKNRPSKKILEFTSILTIVTNAKIPDKTNSCFLLLLEAHVNMINFFQIVYY